MHSTRAQFDPLLQGKCANKKGGAQSLLTTSPGVPGTLSIQPRLSNALGAYLMLSTPGAEVFVGPDCRLRLVKVNPHARIEGLEAHYIITPNAMQPNLPHRRLALRGVQRRFAVPHHVSFGRLSAEFCSRLRWLAMPRIFARIWQQ